MGLMWPIFVMSGLGWLQAGCAKIFILKLSGTLSDQAGYDPHPLSSGGVMPQVTMPHIHNFNLFAQPKVMEHRLLSTLDGPSQAVDLLENELFPGYVRKALSGYFAEADFPQYTLRCDFRGEFGP